MYAHVPWAELVLKSPPEAGVTKHVISFMKFLIVNSDYPAFLKSLYSENPELAEQPYEEQLRVRMETLFGVADFYSRNLRKLGHQAWDIHANNLFMQRSWAEQFVTRPSFLLENQAWKSTLKRVRTLANQKPVSYAYRFLRPIWSGIDQQEQRWFYGVLAEQIKHYNPDVLLNQDIVMIKGDFLKELRSHFGMLVGQHASLPMPAMEEFREYDLALSSSPSIVDLLKQNGIKSRLHRLAFEADILKQVSEKREVYDVTFVGSCVPGIHDNRRKLLEYLSTRIEQLKIWTPDIKYFPEDSSIRSHYQGHAWGLKLYDILRSSRLTLNHHFDIPGYANNMRLFEATGVGTLLVTDWKENLHEMFEPDREIVAYRNPEECSELIRYYLEHPSKRQTIAEAGQKRTLTDHTYFKRMQEFVEIVEPYLRMKKSQ